MEAARHIGYDVFGATRSQSGSGDTDFKFTGEQLDADSELYYLRARYYDPEIGRFLGQTSLRHYRSTHTASSRLACPARSIGNTAQLLSTTKHMGSMRRVFAIE